jgi:chemotaxis family two-component system sensor kinase Cph1
MQQLINDLLSYSRVGRGDLNNETVDLNKVLKRVIRSQQVSIQDAAAEIVCGALPIVCADPTQMLQLLQILIANAVKYRAPRASEIFIGAELREGKSVFYVRDNGIGIDSEFTDRIFEIFQRLHGRSEYTGTGIGLSICKRIVESHGGKIWVESEVDAGATFFFTFSNDRIVEPRSAPQASYSAA